MMFQMTFAIITPALIAGAFAERLKFSALLILTVLWSIFVYAPIAHWVWGGGFLGAMGVMDFAGGTVVHINAGIAGLVCALVLPKRKGLGSINMAPNNLVYTMIGASLLWVGWFGFNAGSAVASNALAGDRHGQHPDRHRRGGDGVDGRGVDPSQEADHAWHGLGRGCRPRRRHPRLRLGPCRRRRSVDRPRGRRRLLLQLGLPQGLAEVRRQPGLLRRPRRRRLHRRHADWRLRQRGGQRPCRPDMA